MKKLERLFLSDSGGYMIVAFAVGFGTALLVVTIILAIVL